MTKSKQGFSLIVMLLIVSMCLIGTIGTYSAKAAESTVDISTPIFTKYFMTVPIKGLTVQTAFTEKSSIVNPNTGCKAFSRSDCVFSVILTFPQVQYKDPVSGVASGVLVTRLTTVNMPAYMSTGCKIKFVEDLKINVRESYYNYFTSVSGVDFTKFQITLLKDRYVQSVFNRWKGDDVFSSDVVFSVEEVNTDPNDPNSPDFDMGDNGGVNPLPEETPKSFLRLIYDFLTNLFHWKLSYSTFCIIFWCIVGVFIFSILTAIFAPRK